MEQAKSFPFKVALLRIVAASGALVSAHPDVIPKMGVKDDFLFGPKTPDGEDTYVLCEINVIAVLPIPDDAPKAIAETTLRRLKAARASPNANSELMSSNGDTHV